MIVWYSWIPHTIKTDTQGCGAGLADTKLSPFIDITLFDTETPKTGVHISIDHNNSSIFTFTHFSRFTHISNNNTFSLYIISVGNSNCKAKVKLTWKLKWWWCESCVCSYHQRTWRQSLIKPWIVLVLALWSMNLIDEFKSQTFSEIPNLFCINMLNMCCM